MRRAAPVWGPGRVDEAVPYTGHDTTSCPSRKPEAVKILDFFLCNSHLGAAHFRTFYDSMGGLQ